MGTAVPWSNYKEGTHHLMVKEHVVWEMTHPYQYEWDNTGRLMTVI